MECKGQMTIIHPGGAVVVTTNTQTQRQVLGLVTTTKTFDIARRLATLVSEGSMLTFKHRMIFAA